MSRQCRMRTVENEYRQASHAAAAVTPDDVKATTNAHRDETAKRHDAWSAAAAMVTPRSVLITR